MASAEDINRVLEETAQGPAHPRHCHCMHNFVPKRTQQKGQLFDQQWKSKMRGGGGIPCSKFRHSVVDTKLKCGAGTWDGRLPDFDVWVQVVSLILIPVNPHPGGSRWWPKEHVPVTHRGDTDWVLGSWFRTARPWLWRAFREKTDK